MISVKSLFNAQVLLRNAFAASLAFLLTFFLAVVFVSLFQATHMDSFAANGSFQLYNPLRRLSEGQSIGFDFPFFHGIGIPLLHYPLFSLLGSDLFASEFVKWFISPTFFLASTLIFFYACFKNIHKAIIATALYTIVAFFCIGVIWPGNSLIGLRGTFPILIAAALIWRSEKHVRLAKFRIQVSEMIALVLLGIGMIFGTEQGIAAIMAYAIVKAFAIVLSRPTLKDGLIRFGFLAVKGVVILIIAFIGFFLASNGHPLEPIRYALIDVPQDQGWYFGVDPVAYLHWGNLLPEIFNYEMRYVLLSIALGLLCVYLTVKRYGLSRYKLTFSFLITYGLIAFLITIIGYYSPSAQLIPLTRVMALIVVLTVSMLLFNSTYWKSTKRSKATARIRLLLIFFLFIAIPLLNTFYQIKDINSLPIKDTVKKTLESPKSTDYDTSSQSWKNRIDSFKGYIDPSKSVWSTYTSIYDAHFGSQLNTSRGGEDYIIHALGDERREQYTRDFIDQKPDYVITLKPSYFIFEEWLWSSNWSFYKELFSNYRVIKTNDSHFLWQRNNEKQTANTHKLQRVEIENNSFALPVNTSSTPLIYTINIRYKIVDIPSPLKRIDRYFLTIHGDSLAQKYRVSLPSHKSSWTFPVVATQSGSPLRVSPSVAGIIPGVTVKITGVTYETMEIGHGTIEPIRDAFCTANARKSIPDTYPLRC